MIIKRKYKSDLTKSNILHKKNILSWNTETKDNQLEISELGWGFIWCLFKRKIRGKIYLLVSSIKENYSIDFFYLKK